MEKEINKFIYELRKSQKISVQEISDGYHTFKELYDHRNLLFLVLAKLFHENDSEVWKTKKDERGISTGSWFILGIDYTNPEGTEQKQITYHLPMNMWKLCKFATVVPKSKWDGHSGFHVLEQLKEFLNYD